MATSNDDTPVEEGLRILAKLIARRIMKSKQKGKDSPSENGNEQSDDYDNER